MTTEVIDLNIGEIYTLNLGLNASTGQSIKYATSDGLIVSSSYITSCKGDNVGCGGKMTFSISANEEGFYLFTIFSGRTWEVKNDNIPKLRTIIFKVNKRKYNTTLYLYKGHITAYMYNSKLYLSSGKDASQNRVPIDNEYSINLRENMHGRVEFLYKNGDLFYLYHPSMMSDALNTLYDNNGKKIGIPSGGFTGKGDGKTSLKGYELLDSITIK